MKNPSVKIGIDTTEKSITASISRTALSELKKSLSDLKEIDTYLTKINNSNTMLSKSDLEQIGTLSLETADLSKLTSDDLIQANQKAHKAALDHNAALKQQTLGAPQQA